MTPLSDADRTVLDLASSGLSGAALIHKINDAGLGEIEYYQSLTRLLDREAALANRPGLVNRLRRIRRRR